MKEKTFHKLISIPYIVGILLLIFCMFFLSGCDVEPLLPTDEIQVCKLGFGEVTYDPHLKITLRNGYSVKDYTVDYESKKVILNLEEYR